MRALGERIMAMSLAISGESPGVKARDTLGITALALIRAAWEYPDWHAAIVAETDEFLLNFVSPDGTTHGEAMEAVKNGFWEVA